MRKQRRGGGSLRAPIGPTAQLHLVSHPSSTKTRKETHVDRHDTQPCSRGRMGASDTVLLMNELAQDGERPRGPIWGLLSSGRRINGSPAGFSAIKGKKKARLPSLVSRLLTLLPSPNSFGGGTAIADPPHSGGPKAQILRSCTRATKTNGSERSVGCFVLQIVMTFVHGWNGTYRYHIFINENHLRNRTRQIPTPAATLLAINTTSLSSNRSFRSDGYFVILTFIHPDFPVVVRGTFETIGKSCG